MLKLGALPREPIARREFVSIQPTEASKLHASHTREAIRDRLQGGPNYLYLRDFIYGAIDGTVTTFAVVSGMAGANLSDSLGARVSGGIVIVMGVANLIADGFSMAASNFLGTRAEHDLRLQARATEENHIDVIPEGEEEEIRQIYAAKGFSGTDLETIVSTITSDRKLWVDTMIQEEHGMSLEGPSALQASVVTLLAFVIVGSIPLLPFFVDMTFHERLTDPFLPSSLLTGVAFFAVGAAKSRFVTTSWWKSGVETLLVGGSAAVLAYAVGRLLGGLAL